MQKGDHLSSLKAPPCPPPIFHRRQIIYRHHIDIPFCGKYFPCKHIPLTHSRFVVLLSLAHHRLTHSLFRCGRTHSFTAASQLINSTFRLPTQPHFGIVRIKRVDSPMPILPSKLALLFCATWGKFSEILSIT